MKMRCLLIVLWSTLILSGAPPIAADEQLPATADDGRGQEQGLSKEAVARISGDSGRIAQRGMTKEFVFSTTVRNDNPDWTVTGLTIAIVPQGTGDPAPKSRDYDVSVTLPPRTTKRIQVDIESIGQVAFSWQVKAAQGRRSD